MKTRINHPVDFTITAPSAVFVPAFAPDCLHFPGRASILDEAIIARLNEATRFQMGAQ